MKIQRNRPRPVTSSDIRRTLEYAVCRMDVNPALVSYDAISATIESRNIRIVYKDQSNVRIEFIR